MTTFDGRKHTLSKEMPIGHCANSKPLPKIKGKPWLHVIARWKIGQAITHIIELKPQNKPEKPDDE